MTDNKKIEKKNPNPYDALKGASAVESTSENLKRFKISIESESKEENQNDN